jgi:hypothetical protein
MAWQKIRYQKLDLNLEVCENARDKITKIDAIIDTLLTTAATSVARGNVARYELDTGQTRTKVEYTSPKEVADTVEMYRRLRKYYENDIVPRVIKAVDGGSMRGTY